MDRPRAEVPVAADVDERTASAMSPNAREKCLICGYRNPWSLGMRFRPHEESGVRGRFHANARWQGYEGILHGGVVAGLLDSAMAHCLFQRGEQGLTGDLHVRFVRPVPCDATLEVHGWIEDATPPLYRLKAEILFGDQVMAWAEAKFLVPRVRD